MYYRFFYFVLIRLYPLKLLFLLLFILVFSLPLLGQKKGWQDVIYLKNGSIIRGNLLEDSVGTDVKIHVTGHNLLVFSAAAVTRVTREYQIAKFDYPYQTGYLHITELGLSLGYQSAVPPFDNTANTGRITGFSLQTFNGYQFFPVLAVGFTAGVDTYQENTLVPVGLGIRGDLSQTRVRPFYGLDAGYALDWLNNPTIIADYDGGFFWSPTIGLKVNATKTLAFVINAGYRSQRATTRFSMNPNFSSTNQHHYKRMLLRVGLSF